MDVSFYTLDSAYDDLKVSVVSVSPGTKPRAVLQFSHGMCGSKERYLPFMKYLAGKGIACVANDHRGHGSSIKYGTDLGYMYDGGHEALVDDMKMLTVHIREKYSGVPVILLGHSMGSMAARAYLRRYPDAIDGIILCGSPGYNPMAPIAYAFLSLACSIGLGRVRPMVMQNQTSNMYNRKFASEGPQAWVCSDPEVRRAFVEDPKHNFKFTLNGLRALLGLMLQSYSSKGWTSPASDLPILFLCGNDDSCAGGPSGVDKAAAVMHEAGYRSIAIKIYPAMRHEVLNEIGKERVWRDVLNFIG